MKKLKSKWLIGTTATLVILLIVISISVIKLISIAADNITPKIEVSLDKYVNYNVAEEKGTLVQYSIRAGNEYEQGQDYIPIKQSELYIDLGKIDDKYPFDVKAIAKNTQATNGNNQEEQPIFEYNRETGSLKITTSNQNNVGEAIYSKGNKQERDEYTLVCYYDTYVAENNSRELELNVFAKYGLFTDDYVEVSKNGNLKTQVSENIGTLTSVKYNTDEVYNGYIKSNVISQTQYSTDYKETSKIEISKKENQEKLMFTENNLFVETVDEADQELGNYGNLTYKSTKISKTDIVNTLGEEGTIQFIDSNKNVIAEINKDTQYAEDGTCTITYETEPEAIYVKTSKILNEGIINFEHIKTIKPSMMVADNAKIKTTNQLIGIKETKATEDGQEKIVEETIYTQNAEKVTEIKDTKTSISLNIENTEWTNKTQNEVTFDLTLNSSNVSQSLFVNPTIRIELPEQVEKVVLGESKLVYGKGIELQEVNVVTDQNGRVNIIATLSGNQTEYNNIFGLETNLKIPAAVILNKELEEDKVTGNVNVIYANEFTTNGNAQVGNLSGNVEIINFKEEAVENQDELEQIFTEADGITVQASPVLSSGLAENLSVDVAPTRGKTLLKNDDTVYEGEYIKYNIKVTNTSNEDIENAKIVVTIPEGVTYGELHVDEYTNLGKYKYNFDEQLREKTIEIGKIDAGQGILAYFEVKVNEIEESQKQITTKIASYIGEEKGQEYQITNNIQKSEIKSFMGAFYYAGQLEYYLNLEADEDTEATVKIDIPKGLKLDNVLRKNEMINDENESRGSTEVVYRKRDDENIERIQLDITNNLMTTRLATNKCYIFTFKIDEASIEKENGKTEKELTTFAVINDKYISNECRIKLAYNNIKTTMVSAREGEKLEYGDEVEYKITIENIGKRKTGVETSADNFVIVNLADILPEEMKGKTITYNSYEYSSEEENSFKELPEKTQNISGKLNGERLDNINLDLLIPEQKSIQITLKATAGRVEQETEIENKATITGENLPITVTNTIKNTIKPYENMSVSPDPSTEPDPTNQTNPTNQTEPSDSNDSNNQTNPTNPSEQNGSENTETKQNYSISGLAWNDENKDGQRQSNEKLLSGVKTLLVDLKNPEATKEATTSNSGTYTFSGLSQGNYIVIFKYDTDKYRITEYQKSGINVQANSDAIEQIVTLNGKQEDVGITDVLQLTNSISNIDIGLIENQYCDFKLDKYISKVTVKTNNGTKEYSYNNESMAKAEIRAKEIEDAIVVVEYKLVVTNIGEATGKIGKLEDILPTGLDFSTDINKGWAQQVGNKLIYTEINNKNIKAGESVEIPLLVTKQMTANSTGIFTNTASIQDIQSTEKAGDANAENNTSKADLIISVSTGVATYITFVVIILGILCTILFLLNKYGKINLKNILKNRKVSAFIIILFGLTFALYGKFELNTLAAEKDTRNSAPSFTIDFCGEQIKIEGDKSTARINASGDISRATYTFEGGDTGWRFYGGPTGYGECQTFGAPAAGYNEETGECSPVTYTKSSASYRTESTVSGESELDFTLDKMDSTLTSKAEGDYCKFGPFKFKYESNTDSEPNYTVTVELGNGSKVNATVEPELNGAGEKEFYIKLTKEQCKNGISRVTLNANAKTKKVIITKVSGTVSYRYDSSCQEVLAARPTYFPWLSVTSEWNPELEKEIEWTDKIPGIIEVEKRDKENNSIKLNGVKIEANGQQNTTSQNGRVTFDNIPVGSSIAIKEIDNENYGYPVLAQQVNGGNPTLVSGQYVLKEMDNEKMTGTLVLEKKDQDTGKALDGVSFKIKKGSKFVKINGQSTINGSTKVEDKTWNEVFTLDNEGTTFITDSNGQIKIENILVSDWDGNSAPAAENLKGDYGIKETDIGSHYGYTEFEISANVDGDYVYVDSGAIGGGIGNAEKESITGVEKGSEGTITIGNRKKYIMVSGNVWEAMLDRELKTADYDMENLVKLQNLKVTLKDKSGNAVTNSNSKAFQNPTYTDAEGHYYFEDVLIDELSNYYVEFEYDGEIYTTAEPNLGETKYESPKAKEIASQRQALDNKYEYVTGMGESSNYDNSQNNVGGNFNVPFKTSPSDNATAITKYREDFDNSLNGNARDVKQFASPYIGDNLISASTNETGYGVLGDVTIEQIRKTDGKDALQAILVERNCGLIQREQVNLSVSSDIAEVEVSINGYKNYYKYEKSAGYNNEQLDNFRMEVKAKKYGYKRKLYKSDIVWLGDDKQEVCEVFVIYKMTVANNSGTLKAKVGDVLGYYQADSYDLYAADINKDNLTNRQSISGSQYNSTYNVAHFNNIKDVEIPAMENTSFYVKYKIKPDKVFNIKDEALELDNPSVIEINTYTTYYGSETQTPQNEKGHSGLYASIDKNSSAGNCIPDNKQTYEDDTASAPSITIDLTRDERTIRGNVFEDTTKDSEQFNTGEERKGDGKYTQGENTVAGVKVNLLQYKIDGSGNVTLTPAVLSKYENGKLIKEVTREKESGDADSITANIEGERAQRNYSVTYNQVVTDASGAYEFKGIVPDEYILKFTYANGNVIYKAGSTSEQAYMINNGTSGIDVNYYKATVITSDIIKDALNNNTVVGDGSTEGIPLPHMTSYSSNKWFEIDEGLRYSDAMDSNAIVTEELNPNRVINNDAYNGNGTFTDSKEAFTGVMNIQIELDTPEKGINTKITTTKTFEGKDSEGGTVTFLYDELNETTENIDFGIAQKAKHAFEVEKTIANLKITTGTGQTLVDGNPSSHNLSYTKYLVNPATMRSELTDIEIDTELLHQSEVELTYETTAKNISELNYATGDYYRYGNVPDESQTETIVASKVIDYLDDSLTYKVEDGQTVIFNGNLSDNGSKFELYKEGQPYNDLNVSAYLKTNEAIESAKNYKVILMLNGDKQLKPGETQSWRYRASKLITSSVDDDELDYENDVEAIEYIGERTKLIPNIILGDYNAEQNSPIETDNYESRVTIHSPTGENRSYTPYIVGGIVLVIMATGIVIIKRKVL